MGRAEPELLEELTELYNHKRKGKMRFKASYRGFDISLEAGSLQQRVHHLTRMAAVKGRAAETGALPVFAPEA
eukprot:4899103-Amphidinium_carterae.1